MSLVIDKFLRYISYDTQSEDGAGQLPSTEKQFVLARLLADELAAMGAFDVTVDEQCYVTASIPATSAAEIPVLGLIAHMDTAPAFSGCSVRPQIIKNYDGSPIPLSGCPGLMLDPADFPSLSDYVGQDLITTDGTTLLGADDKAGIAEIMAAAEYLLNHPEIPHGKIRIAFTPDEEIGRGTDGFDVQAFGADVAYTVDGGALGELEYENFNAAGAEVHIHGSSIHPGSAKGKMKNALLIGMELQSMLPAFENPMYTEGYEGFYHLDQMTGGVEHARMSYIIRDHDMDRFLQKKQLMTEIAGFLNTKYGAGTVEITMRDSYYNMKEKILPYMYLIDVAVECMRRLGIEPRISPIRGGTDGARLSYEGLPCPNLCTGGHNYHGKYEYICIQSMEKVTELLISIAKEIKNNDETILD